MAYAQANHGKVTPSSLYQLGDVSDGITPMVRLVYSCLSMH